MTPNAIAFLDVVKEARDAVYDALIRNDIAVVKLKWVK